MLSVVQMVDAFKQDPELELEGSVGVFASREFQSSVDFETFNALLQALQKTLEADTTGTWSTPAPSPDAKMKFMNFFFPKSVRGTYRIRAKPEFVRKTPCKRVDIICDSRTTDLRVSLRREKPEAAYVAVRPPDRVRLYERYSFVYKNRWRYDLSKVVSGRTKESACDMDPNFEVELEILRGDPEFLTQPSEAIAQSFLEKLTDLLGRFDATGSRIHCTLRPQKTWTKQTTGPSS